MDTEYYSMRLVCEAAGKASDTWPQEIQHVKLSEADAALSDEEKITKAQEIVCDDQ